MVGWERWREEASKEVPVRLTTSAPENYRLAIFRRRKQQNISGQHYNNIIYMYMHVYIKINLNHTSKLPRERR